jgi:hypothetical protein
MAERRGAIILTGHFGNLELLAYAHGRLGYPVTLIHRPFRNRFVDRSAVPPSSKKCCGSSIVPMLQVPGLNTPSGLSPARHGATRVAMDEDVMQWP